MEVVNNAYTNSHNIDEGSLEDILLLDGDVRKASREFIEKISS
jgi:hypothetical protein